MSVEVTPHLNFRGDARQALEFYRSVFGGELFAITYADMGNGDDPATADNLTWGQVTAPSGFRIMAYDVYPHLPYDPGQDPFFVTVRGSDAEEVTGYWAALEQGGKVTVPLAPSAWAPLYGMLTDRFGITWIIDLPAEQG